MKRIVFALLVGFSANLAFAQNQTQLCQRWSANDIFSSFLRLSVSLPGASSSNSTLWIDTHIPYGIRPLPFDISSLECGKDSLEISATSSSENVEFYFYGSATGPETQKGSLLYLDNAGNILDAYKYECSFAAIQNFCAAKTPHNMGAH